MSSFLFDLQRARELALLFFRTTGLPCMITDSVGRVLYHAYDRREQRLVCDYAAALDEELMSTEQRCSLKPGESSGGDRDLPTAASCCTYHLYLNYQARRFGGQYVAFCPLGQTLFGTPILRGRHMVGALLAGPSTLIDPEDLQPSDIRLLSLDAAQFQLLQKHFGDVPSLSPDKAQTSSELLFEFAGLLSDDSFLEMKKSAHDQAVRAHLFNFLTDGDKTTATADNHHFLQDHFSRTQALDGAIRAGDDETARLILTEIQASLLFVFDSDLPSLRQKLQELLVVVSHAFMARGEDLASVNRLVTASRQRMQATSSSETMLYLFADLLLQLQNTETTATRRQTTGVAEKALSWIRAHYFQEIALRDCAQACHLSDSHFSRLLREQTGRSFTENVNFMRIQAARKLLATSDESIAGIAQLVGFRDQSYFTRVFKKLEGVSPGVFREQHTDKLAWQTVADL